MITLQHEISFVHTLKNLVDLFYKQTCSASCQRVLKNIVIELDQIEMDLILLKREKG